jgi:hypothetical protein
MKSSCFKRGVKRWRGEFGNGLALRDFDIGREEASKRESYS